MNEEEKKLFGTPDEDEFILDIGLNRAIDLIDRSNAENILITEPNTNLPVILKLSLIHISEPTRRKHI